MAEIWKYALPIGRAHELAISAPAQIMAVGQDPAGERGPAVWVLVDPAAPPVKWTFFVVGPGWELSADLLDKYTYLGMAETGAFRWHVFGTCLLPPG